MNKLSRQGPTACSPLPRGLGLYGLGLAPRCNSAPACTCTQLAVERRGKWRSEEGTRSRASAVLG
jgi:hypothetical protein